MKTAALLRLILILFALTGCQTPLPKSPVDWPKLAQCAPPVDDLIATVSRVLLQSIDVQEELTELAREHGAEVVVCLVDQLRLDWTAPGAASSPKRTAATTSAQDFLKAVGTEVQRAEPAPELAPAPAEPAPVPAPAEPPPAPEPAAAPTAPLAPVAPPAAPPPKL